MRPAPRSTVLPVDAWSALATLALLAAAYLCATRWLRAGGARKAGKRAAKAPRDAGSGDRVDPPGEPRGKQLALLQEFLGVIDGLGVQGFEDFIGLRKRFGGRGETTPEGLVYRFKIPQRLCGENGVLALGVILSLFDSVSSHAMILSDKTHRPGVSVSLEAEYLSTISAGEEIELISRVVKLGKTMGFASCLIRRVSDGRDCVRGQHIKYLPMGYFWDLAFGYFPSATLNIGSVLFAPRGSTEETARESLSDILDSME